MPSCYKFDRENLHIFIGSAYSVLRCVKLIVWSEMTKIFVRQAKHYNTFSY